MNRTFCDRCGDVIPDDKRVEGASKVSVCSKTRALLHIPVPKTFDLCVQCTADFHEFMKAQDGRTT